MTAAPHADAILTERGRIIALLRDGNKTTIELADKIGKPVRQITRLCRELEDEGRIICTYNAGKGKPSTFGVQ